MRELCLCSVVLWALSDGSALAQSGNAGADRRTGRGAGGTAVVVTPEEPGGGSQAETQTLEQTVVLLQKAKEKAARKTGAEQAAALEEVRGHLGHAADMCEAEAARSQADGQDFLKLGEELRQNSKPLEDNQKVLDAALAKTNRVSADWQEKANAARMEAQKNPSPVTEDQARYLWNKSGEFSDRAGSLKNLVEGSTADAVMISQEIEALEAMGRFTQTNAELMQALARSFRSEEKVVTSRKKLAEHGWSGAMHIAPIATGASVTALDPEREKQFQIWLKGGADSASNGKVTQR